MQAIAVPRTAASDRDPWAVGLLSATLVMNLIDMILTITLVNNGLADEANPVMAAAFVGGAPGFGLAKLALVTFGAFVLWRHRARPLASFGIGVVFCAYAATMIYHLKSLEILSQYWGQ